MHACRALVCDLQLMNMMCMLQTPASPPSTVLEPKSPLPGTRERKGTDGWDSEEWGNLEEDPVQDTLSCISIVHKEDNVSVILTAITSRRAKPCTTPCVYVAYHTIIFLQRWEIACISCSPVVLIFLSTVINTLGFTLYITLSFCHRIEIMMLLTDSLYL